MKSNEYKENKKNKDNKENKENKEIDKTESNLNNCTVNEKRGIDKERILHILINFLIYFIVLFIKGDESAVLILFKILPALLILNSFIYGFKAKGCDSTYSFMSAIAFIPFVLFYLGETAWVFLLIYVSLIMISNVTGSFIAGLLKKDDDPIGCNCKGIF